VEITVVRELGQPSLIIQPDRAKIARYGLNVSDINTLIETAVGGTAASVPSMGRNSLDERSQPEPMTATVAKRKA
jgi:heavy metal efflux system protein